MTSVVVIGDQHFKIDNLHLIARYIQKIGKIIQEKNPTFVVLLGDMLHTHERIHTLTLNKAYEFIDFVRKLCKTYILVGNHDHINGTQFLTSNHWLNGLKEWENIVIVDDVYEEIINEKKFVFSPYVPAGRFQEALNTLENDWKDAICIFAHQEFYNCKMGSILSVEGDEWPLEYPNIISGHIHDNQTLQENIYYPGSSLEVSYGQNNFNIIAYVEFENDNSYTLEELELNMPQKKIIYIDIENIDEYKTPVDSENQYKLSLNGDYNEFKSFKKSQKYKEIINKGIKVVFKPKKKDLKIKNEKLAKIIDNNTENLTDFSKIIKEIIEEQNNYYLNEVYNLVINNTIKKEEIIFV